MNNPYQNNTVIIGKSQILNKKLELIAKIADTSKNILILGETGTGKELVARKIHELSERRGFPFITINCANLSSELFESELLGHVRGAFTGAIDEKKGLIEIAEKGM